MFVKGYMSMRKEEEKGYGEEEVVFIFDIIGVGFFFFFSREILVEAERKGF